MLAANLDRVPNIVVAFRFDSPVFVIDAVGLLVHSLGRQYAQ